MHTYIIIAIAAYVETSSTGPITARVPVLIYIYTYIHTYLVCFPGRSQDKHTPAPLCSRMSGPLLPLAATAPVVIGGVIAAAAAVLATIALRKLWMGKQQPIGVLKSITKR